MQVMSRRTLMFQAATLVAGLGVACSGSTPTPAPIATPRPPAKPAPALTQPAAAPTKPVAAATKPAVSPASAGSAGLIPQFAALNTAIAVQSAQAYLAYVGFHEMGETIKKVGRIEPGQIGSVRNATIVVGTVPWPAALTKEQQMLSGEMKALETALVANKPDDAAKAADSVHEAEHDFSKAVFGWMGAQSGLSQTAVFKTMDDPNHLLGCVGVQSSQAYIERAAFHEMAEQIDTTKKIDPGYISTVRGALTVANAFPRPGELTEEQQKLIAEMRALEAALVANKPDDAAKAADRVHDAEHDLTKATFAWLASMKHDHGAMMAKFGDDQTIRSMVVTGVRSGQAYIEAAEFHKMAEKIEKAKAIESGYIGTVRNAIIVAEMVHWPAELANEQRMLVKELKGLEVALVANKVEDAARAADQVHEAEHDLSKATFAWLATGKAA